MLNQLNINLFNYINQFANHSLFLNNLGVFFAKYLVYIFVLIIIILWFTNKKNKNISFYVFYATVLGLIINYIVTIFYFHPRPFMINLGTQLINHSIGTSLPSDHTTILLSIAIMLIYFKNTKKLGIILTIFGLLGGISRIFCGVHFPLDIIASIFVALISTYTIYKLIPKLEKVNKFLLNIYFWIFKKLNTILKV